MSPTYPFECLTCGWEIETYRKIEHRDCSTECKCGEDMVRAIARPNINPDMEPYLDPNLVPMHSNEKGRWVKSRRHRNEVMREMGVTASG